MSAFKFFNSCYNCKPPKRYPGCHATCPDYAKDKADYENMKAIVDYEKKMDDAVHTPGFYRTLKRKRNKEKK
jgi:hypothetical protein